MPLYLVKTQRLYKDWWGGQGEKSKRIRYALKKKSKVINKSNYTIENNAMGCPWALTTTDNLPKQWSI